MNKQVSYAYQHLSRTETLFKGENKNINISVSKNSPVNASLSLDGYKHSMVQIIALTIALKMKTVIVNPPIVSDTYVFIAIINELGGTAKIYNKRLFIDASTICNANICKRQRKTEPHAHEILSHQRPRKSEPLRSRIIEPPGYALLCMVAFSR